MTCKDGISSQDDENHIFGMINAIVLTKNEKRKNNIFQLIKSGWVTGGLEVGWRFLWVGEEVRSGFKAV